MLSAQTVAVEPIFDSRSATLHEETLREAIMLLHYTPKHRAKSKSRRMLVAIQPTQETMHLQELVVPVLLRIHQLLCRLQLARTSARRS
jgi:hypothetical protein